MRGRRKFFLLVGIVLCGCLAVLCVRYLIHVGYCKGLWGKQGGLLNYFYQCSCPPEMENTRIQKLYSEHAEIMFSACDNVGPIPSPSGQKVAVINYEKPDESYVWFLQTDEKMSFTWPAEYADLIWLSDDLLLVYYWTLDVNVVDLETRTVYPISVRADVRPFDGEMAPSVLSALREAEFVVLTRGTDVMAISPDALVSSERSFVIPSDASDERMRQFLQEQDIDYLDYTSRGGTDVLFGPPRQAPYVDLPSPDGRFFYRIYPDSENGIYLVETGERIVDPIDEWLIPIGWVYDGVIFQRGRGHYLIHLGDDDSGLVWEEGWIREPWLKLQIPPEYNVSDTGSDHD